MQDNLSEEEEMQESYVYSKLACLFIWIFALIVAWSIMVFIVIIVFTSLAQAAVKVIIQDGPGRIIECTFSASKANSFLDEVNFKSGQTQIVIKSNKSVCKVKGICPVCPVCPEPCNAPKICAIPKVCPDNSCKSPKQCIVPPEPCEQCGVKFNPDRHMNIPRNCYYYARWRPDRRHSYKPLLKCYSRPFGDYYQLHSGNKPNRKPVQ